MLNLNTNKVFCDTSFFVSFSSRRELDYQRSLEILEYLVKKQTDLYTTWHIISETLTLLLYRYGAVFALKFLDQIKPNLEIIELNDDLRAKTEQVFRQFAQDKDLSYCDAASYVVVREVLGNQTPCLTLDSDFESLGLTVVK